MNIKTVVAILVIVLVCVLGYVSFIKKLPQTEQMQVSNSQNTKPATPSQDLAQCGSINQQILTQYNYQPSETEKEATIKSLTCINQALIKCSSGTLVINNGHQTTSINVKGKGKGSLGCNVSLLQNTGETITCPLPADYTSTLQKKFVANNYDGTIVTDLITNINAEISSGNKGGACTVTK